MSADHPLTNPASLKMTIKYAVLTLFCLVFFTNCSDGDQEGQDALSCYDNFGSNTEWGGETEVEIDGYASDANEPKVSSDQVTLFWNDKPVAGDDHMNIHYAVKQPNGRYLYIGTLPGTVDPSSLDGVPALDILGNFYFVSLRSYFSNFRTIYGGQIQVLGPNSLAVGNVASADSAVTLGTAGKLDMDIDVSWDGSLMVASRAEFSGGKAFPDRSRLALYDINTTTRQATLHAQSDFLLAQVNVSNCAIYAGTFSPDLKELYYALYPIDFTSDLSIFRIAVSKRNSTSDPFGPGEIIAAITGDLTEAPAITYDDSGKTMFYHKVDPASGRKKIYKVTRP